MQMAERTADRARNIDLSQRIDSSSLTADLQKAYAYIGSPYLRLDNYPSDKYWGALGALYSIFSNELQLQ